ncbi:MAG: hypothetical protein A3A86_01470 [Elusimicrobia bacterium RIFCSPLOWO2_01_FULL_60_11]|nr:MAG: hypothetical protein A3A86_01470 [Elusimicrobia bacterium RIFCSPLOWO2_01_FULL_60_11]
MNQISAHKVGLALGGLFGIGHVVWALMVLAGLAKTLLDWILGLHFLNLQYSIDPFSLGNAALLVVVTAVIGYLVGYVFGWLWNLAYRTAHGQ